MTTPAAFAPVRAVSACAFFAFLCCANHAAGQATLTATPGPSTATYQNKTLGFQFDYPQGWTAKEARFTHAHYTDAFLTVNSRRPDLQIKEMPAPGTTGPNPAAGPRFLTPSEQMQPGEVYLELAFQEGPGPFMMQDDAVGADLRTLLAANLPASTTDPNLWQSSLAFFKRGKLWRLTVYLRAPINEDDRKRVIALLQSFRFVDAPVGNIAWAESLAWQQLPSEVKKARVNIGWPVPQDFGMHPKAGLQSVVAQKSGTDFLFTFTEDKVGTWKVRVTENGQAQLTSPSPSPATKTGS